MATIEIGAMQSEEIDALLDALDVRLAVRREHPFSTLFHYNVVQGLRNRLKHHVDPLAKWAGDCDPLAGMDEGRRDHNETNGKDVDDEVLAGVEEDIKTFDL